MFLLQRIALIDVFHARAVVPVEFDLVVLPGDTIICESKLDYATRTGSSSNLRWCYITHNYFTAKGDRTCIDASRL